MLVLSTPVTKPQPSYMELNGSKASDSLINIEEPGQMNVPIPTRNN